jgi:hypothetical protein
MLMGTYWAAVCLQHLLVLNFVDAWMDALSVFFSEHWMSDTQ